MARTDLEQLVYQMNADIKSLTAANKRALSDVKATTTSAQREYDKLAAEMGRGFGRASLAAGVAFGAIVGYATKAASDASETANAFQVAFGSLEKQAQAFAKSYSKDVGRALDETQATMAKTQLVLTGVGVAAKDALGMTEAIQRRSIDIGSLWNVSDAEAYQAILSGISGEAEPLKKFGVALNETAVQAELLRLGFKGNAQQAPEAAKSIARLNIIMRASASADGDAIRTKDGLANKTKAAQAAFRDLSVAFGQNFLPAAADAAKAATNLLLEFEKLPDGAKLAGLAMLGLVAGAGPIAALISGLSKVIKFAGLARAALIGVVGAEGAAGAAGVAAGVAGAVGGAGVVAGGAVAGAGAVTLGGAYVLGSEAMNQGRLKKVLVNVRQASDKDLAASLRYLEGLPQGRVNSQATQGLIKGEIAARANAVTATAEAAAKKATEDATKSFGLSEDLKKPVTTGNKNTGKTEAEKAADLAARQADRYNADMARAKDDELRSRQELLRSIEDQARIARERIDTDEKARTEDLKLAVQKKELTQVQADQIAAAEGQARNAARDAIDDQKKRDLAAESLRQSQEVAGYELDALQAQADLAKTFGERLAIERRILAIKQEQEKAALEQDLATNPNLSDKDKDARRRGLGTAQAAAAKALDESAVANLKTNIVGAFEAAKGGIGSVADYFGDRLKAKLLDSLAEAAARAILSDGGSSGSGGDLSGAMKLAKSFVGFFDSGGSIPAGKFGVAGERGPEIVKGPASVVSRLATLRAVQGTAITPVQATRTALSLSISPSKYFDAHVQETTMPMTVQAGVTASEVGAAKAVSQSARRSRYAIARR